MLVVLHVFHCFSISNCACGVRRLFSDVPPGGSLRSTKCTTKSTLYRTPQNDLSYRKNCRHLSFKTNVFCLPARSRLIRYARRVYDIFTCTDETLSRARWSSHHVTISEIGITTNRIGAYCRGGP